jgi:hypothetical protein
MPTEPERKLSDEELDQLARELFAEVRGEPTEEEAERVLKSAGEVAGELLPGVPDWLLQAGDDAEDGGGPN